MIRSLWSAATGMQAQTLNIDVISNNLANVGTSGFKKSRADFQDLLYQTIGYRWAENLREYGTLESDQFFGYYDQSDRTPIILGSVETVVE